jgi:hypothetical protein
MMEATPGNDKARIFRPNGRLRFSGVVASSVFRSLIGAPNRTVAQYLEFWDLEFGFCVAPLGVFRIRPLVGSRRCLSRMKVGLVNPPSKK